MSDEIIRYWKDEDFRQELSPERLAELPTNPAGLIELTDDDLGNADGGTTVTPDPCCFWISVSVAVTLAGPCTSVIHGSCKAVTVGCCGE
jgi:mersacidin/lichenicidin family type 2 lantibiotic